jgi:hypothetical protein
VSLPLSYKPYRGNFFHAWKFSLQPNWQGEISLPTFFAKPSTLDKLQRCR